MDDGRFDDAEEDVTKSTTPTKNDTVPKAVSFELNRLFNIIVVDVH